MNHPLTPKLSELDTYSSAQLQDICSAWPSVARYWPLLQLQPTTEADQLRQHRHHSWLKAVFATYFERASCTDICLYWSHQAERAIATAWSLSGCAEQPLALFALGKLGAEELNLSSDVDLMLIADTPQFEMKSVRHFQQLLQEPSAFGQALRVDFDLRAGGRLGPLISTVEQFQDYYGNYGETWERLAFVRLRALHGPSAVIEKVLHFARRFSFRKHLDYTLFEDLKQLRPKFHQADSADHIHLKLGRGGIRDIELFVHALQIIHGGKDTDLQQHQTQRAIEQLQTAGALPSSDGAQLIDAYWRLRDLENRLQAFGDQQIHSVQLSRAPQRTFQKTSIALLQTEMKNIDTLVSTLLGPGVETNPSALPEVGDAAEDWFKARGFQDHIAREVWPKLISTQVRSRHKARDEKARRLFLAQFLSELEDIALDKDLALSLLNDFVHATRAKASFFTLLNRSPELIKNLAWLLSTSPYLGQLLAGRPELLDAFFFRLRESLPLDFEDFLTELIDQRLLTELITANDFLTQKNTHTLLSALSDKADDIARDLLNRIKYENEATDSRIDLLLLGKWAGHEIGFRSDLDFIFVSPEPVTSTDQRVARQFIHTLSASGRGGSLYSIDMRLRPSGHAGPVITTAQRLEEFLSREAPAWQCQAYSKSRGLQHPETSRQWVAQRGLKTSELRELGRIRHQLRRENSSSKSHLFHLKYHPGGLVDIEFAAQTFLLTQNRTAENTSTPSMIAKCAEISPHWRPAHDTLQDTYLWLRTVEQLYQLTSLRSGSDIDFQTPAGQRLGQLLALDSDQLKRELTQRLSETQNILATLDPALKALTHHRSSG